MGKQKSNPDSLSAGKLFFEILNTIRIRERRVYRSIIAPIFELGFRQFQEGLLELIVQKPDAVVIQGIYDLDEQIFDYMYKRYFPMIESRIRMKGGDSNVANDVFQETIVDIIEQVRRGKFNIEKSVEGYIITIAVRKWSKILSKRIKNRQASDEEDQIIDDSPTIEDLIEPTDNFEEVSGWLDELSETCKTLINEFYYNKKSWDKIASEHGYKNARSASNQKYKCLESLKDKITLKRYGML